MLWSRCSGRVDPSAARSLAELGQRVELLYGVVIVIALGKGFLVSTDGEGLSSHVNTVTPVAIDRTLLAASPLSQSIVQHGWLAMRHANPLKNATRSAAEESVGGELY